MGYILTDILDFFPMSCSPCSPSFCLLLSQDVVLMRALRDMNLPKFVFEDVPLFLGLISDLFPGLDCPRVRYPNFNDAVEQNLQDNKYVLIPNQVAQLDHRVHSLDTSSPLKMQTLTILCAFRWIKWYRCMRPWWPDTPRWLWVQLVEGNQL